MSLKELLAADECLIAPGAYDPYSALVVESLDFKAVYLGGNALGLQLGVGQPFVTATETAAAVQAVRRVTRLPVIVDAGAGFGDPVHAAHAVRQIARAGASALHVDDQPYPKRAHYHKGIGGLCDAHTAYARIRVAREALNDEDTLLVARTDALRVTGSLQATIERGGLLRDAGAEALLVLDLAPSQVQTVQAALPGLHLLWIGGIHEPVPSVGELTRAGFAAALYPFNAMAAVTDALQRTWCDLRETGLPLVPVRPAAQLLKDAFTLVGMENNWKIESETAESGREQI